MSTKIFNGFEFIGENDIRTIQKNLNEFKKELEPIVNKFLVEYLVGNSVAYHDDVMYLGRKIESECSPLWFANYEHRDRVKKIKNTNLRDPEVDFDFEIVILPIKDKILGTHYTEQGEFLKLLSEKPWFKRYGYWDNTNQDSSCTDEEWDKRYYDWEEAMPGYDTPAYLGFSVQLTNPNMFNVLSDHEELFNSLIPDKIKRAKPIIQTQMRKEYLDRENIKYDSKSKLADEQLREIWDKVYDFNKLLKTTLKEEYESKTTEMATKLCDLDYNILKKPLEITNK